MKDESLRVLTVRIRNEQDSEAVRYVMRETGCHRAAQAVLQACRSYVQLNERQKPFITELQHSFRKQQNAQNKVIRQLREENKRLRKTLDAVRAAIDTCSDKGPSGTIYPQTGE